MAVEARELSVHRVVDGGVSPPQLDFVAVEEPLEIQLGFSDSGRKIRTLSITMRTPGHDRELAAGFLFGEGVITDASQISSSWQRRNLIRLELRPDVEAPWERLQRHVYTSSSCGVCGSASIRAVTEKHGSRVSPGQRVHAEIISSLPGELRKAQSVFDQTGGLHAAALFDFSGTLEAVYEDVGRHNAVDKLVGSQVLAGRTLLEDRMLMVSGRASFELVQKALAAGIPILAAVGAPSSLAVDLAEDGGLTLAGFLRGARFNIYSGLDRIVEAR